jgi:hypothetical protein
MDGMDGMTGWRDGMSRDQLRGAPGIGPSLARDLCDLGVRTLASLARQNPERLYERLGEIRGRRQDPCVLYAFRCAVYFARTPKPKPELLLWWNWKGRTLRPGSGGGHGSQ